MTVKNSKRIKNSDDSTLELFFSYVSSYFRFQWHFEYFFGDKRLQFFDHNRRYTSRVCRLTRRGENKCVVDECIFFSSNYKIFNVFLNSSQTERLQC